MVAVILALTFTIEILECIVYSRGSSLHTTAILWRKELLFEREIYSAMSHESSFEFSFCRRNALLAIPIGGSCITSSTSSCGDLKVILIEIPKCPRRRQQVLLILRISSGGAISQPGGHEPSPNLEVIPRVVPGDHLREIRIIFQGYLEVISV